MENIPYNCMEMIFALLCVVDIVELSTVNRKINETYKKIMNDVQNREQTDKCCDHYKCFVSKKNAKTFATIPNYVFNRTWFSIDLKCRDLIAVVGNLSLSQKSQCEVYDSSESIDFSKHMDQLSGINKLTIYSDHDGLDDELFQRMLNTIETLHMAYTTIKNVRLLNSVKYIDLSGTKVQDVSALKNAVYLNLSRCANIIDFSMLGNVHHLILAHTNIIDVSMLGNVHTLDLSYTFVSDVSALANVHTLDLSYTFVSDVSMLEYVDELFIRNTYVEEDDLSSLSHIRKLHVRCNPFTCDC